jgi:hypothetical protein
LDHLVKLIGKPKQMDSLFSDVMQNSYMLTKGEGKNEISEKGLFVQMMPHKRQGLQDLLNYSLYFTSGDIQNFHMTFLFVEREKNSYKKEYYPA